MEMNWTHCTNSAAGPCDQDGLTDEACGVKDGHPNDRVLWETQPPYKHGCFKVVYVSKLNMQKRMKIFSLLEPNIL